MKRSLGQLMNKHWDYARIQNRILTKKQKRIAYCTIASANYLGHVQVLADSLEKHNPDSDLFVLLCEHPAVCKKMSSDLNFLFLSPADIGCANWVEMAFYYDITEFNTSLKPFFLEHILEKGYDAVLYFDPDIEIYNSLKELEGLMSKFDIVLTPHHCKLPPDDLMYLPAESLRTGQFNLGFLGISGAKESRELLKWWQNVCIRKCTYEAVQGYRIFFFDQFWAAMFPSFIEKTLILRETGYNAAYWNIYQRDLKFQNGKWLIDGRELKFYHFSSLALDDLTKVSRLQERITAPVGSDLYRLLSEYVERLDKAAWHIFASYPYSFGKYSTGQLITDEEKKHYYLLSPAERKELGNPFENIEKLRVVDFNIDLIKEEKKRNGASIKGMGYLEGPYPEWDLPEVRWAKEPRVRIDFDNLSEERGGSVLLSMSFRPQVRPSAQMTVNFNGEETTGSVR